MAEEFTARRLARVIQELYGPDVIRQVNRWLARGDGVAVYQNQDLGHPDLGQLQLASYGSPAAQLETGEPPQVLPDMAGRVNWRYQLTGTYRGEPLPLPAGEAGPEAWR